VYWSLLIYKAIDLNMTSPMNSATNNKKGVILKQKLDAGEADFEYNESEDEDYDPNKDKSEDNNHASDKGTRGVSESDDITEDDRREMKKYKSIESSVGGLVKTRHQREQEHERSREQKWQRAMNKSKKESNLDIDSIWAELQGKSREVLSGKRSSLTEVHSPSSKPTFEKSSTNSNTAEVGSFSLPVKEQSKKVRIKRTYEFAGKVVTEEKWVDSSSQEARAQLNSLKLEGVEKNHLNKASATSKRTLDTKNHHSNLRRKRRRPGLLEAVINGSSAAKISTLEKSRLDWAKYVDKEKIHDELKYKNKAGYLDNQDFLNRVSTRQNSLYRDARADARKKQ